MKIWIDADACPNKIKDITFRAAIRTKTVAMVVANHYIQVPSSPFIKAWKVDSGFDVADTTIVVNMEENDLVITADIPLANAVINNKGIALNPRGILYTEKNIKQILATRDLNESLRSNGMISGGSAKLNQMDIQKFSNHLDTLLRKAQS